MIVLQPGVEGNRALGTHAKPGIYVRFSGGTVIVKDENIAKMLREHSQFNNEFLEVKDSDVDPYADTRTDIEPEHFVAEIKYGHLEKAISPQKKTKLSPELKKLIESEALKMLPSLLKANPKILKGIIMDLADDMKAKEEVLKEGEEATKEKVIRD